MTEIENREDKSAFENAKAIKHVFKSKMKSVKEEKWKKKALLGQYLKIVEKRHVDTVTTNKWLSSNLKGETEGLLVAAQDQAINTRNYQKVICGQQVESKCRMCSQHEETVDHIVSTKEMHAVRKLSVWYKIPIWFQNTVCPETKDAFPKIQASAYNRYSRLHRPRLA